MAWWLQNLEFLTDPYLGECGWLCNIYAYGRLWYMWVQGGWVDYSQMLTDAYGGYGWVGRKYLKAYGCLRGGWVDGFVKIRCLRNIWTAPKILKSLLNPRSSLVPTKLTLVKFL